MTAIAYNTAPYSIELEILGLPSISSNGPHGHWAKKANERKKWHALVAYSIGYRVPASPLHKAKVTLIRHSSSEPDSDGLVISFKPILDALVKGKVLVNDKRENIGMPHYDWQYAPPRKGFISIKVEEVQEIDIWAEHLLPTGHRSKSKEVL